MRRIVTGDHVAEWVARRVGRSIELPATTLGVEIDGRLAGGVVFSGWNGFDIEITVAGDREAYRYLAESIRRFPPQAAFAAMIERAGFSLVKHRNLSGGIAALHSGWVV